MKIKDVSFKVRHKSSNNIYDVKHMTEDEICVLVPFPFYGEGEKILEIWQPKERFELLGLQKNI